MIQRTQRCAARQRSSELGDLLSGHDQVSLVMHLEAEMKQHWKCTWMEARIEPIQSCMGTPWLGKDTYLLWGSHSKYLEMHVEAMIVQTCSLWSSKLTQIETDMMAMILQMWRLLSNDTGYTLQNHAQVNSNKYKVAAIESNWGCTWWGSTSRWSFWRCWNWWWSNWRGSIWRLPIWTIFRRRWSIGMQYIRREAQQELRLHLLLDSY